MKFKKIRGVEKLKSRYGTYFVLPWCIGFILFFLLPLVQSFMYSFSDTTLISGGIELDFIGIKNFKSAIFEDPNYMDNLISGITSFFYTCPFILVISFVLAIILNQEFIGKTLFRGMYFIPVIIAGGVVMELMFNVGAGDITNTQMSTDLMDEMINVSTLISFFGLPSSISGVINDIMSNIMQMVWSSGVQIVLFIAGMQSVPDLLYEVAKVEGATKWETFWFVTFPMLSHVTVLVLVFTMVEHFTVKTDAVLTQAYNLMQTQVYGESSAMLWLYFIVVGIVMAIVLFGFYKLCVKRWE